MKELGKVIENYIKKQLQKDIMKDQISFKEYITRLRKQE